MMKTTVMTIVFSAALLTACGAETDQASAVRSDTKQGDVAPGRFKLYTSSRQIPDINCDVHTDLVLANGFVGPIASLENAVTGACRMAFEVLPRSFNLKEIAGECGTRRYVGVGVEIIDNRERTCKDVIAADLVVIEEGTPSGDRSLTATTFYSFDPQR